jgi:hypothetical protein
MVGAYWEVGRVIVEEEQAGKESAGYGKRVLEGLAGRLQAEFGKGFDQSNLRNMRTFFVTYPIRDALRHELSWTHYRLLLRLDNPTARAFYEAEAINARWSTREILIRGRGLSIWKAPLPDHIIAPGCQSLQLYAPFPTIAACREAEKCKG